MIFHLAEATHWAAAQASGAYAQSTQGRTLADEGFIHASNADQWPAVRARFYADYPGELVLLTIDPALLQSQVRLEVGDPATGELFPHIYGPINLPAVVAVRVLQQDKSRRSRPPGMIAVAKLAGVSHQTVSRVLNDHPSVRPATRDRVLEAIRELDYRRNLAARTLVTGRSQTLGVVSFDTTLYGPASTLYGIEQAARARGYSVIIVSLKEIDHSSMLEALDRLTVDGTVVIAPQESATNALADLPPNIPVVAIGSSAPPGVPLVSVDDDSGAARATQHLLDLGHPTVWHVTRPAQWMSAGVRTAAWRRTLEQAGADVPDPVIGDWSARSGYEAGKLLAKQDKVSAVFVANDHMTLGVLRAFAEAGLRVPQDISLVGFDDIPEAAYFSPPLTTVRQDFDEVGQRSLDLLLERIDGQSGETLRTSVPASLVVRLSSASYRGKPRAGR